MFCGQLIEKDFPMFLLNVGCLSLEVSEASNFLFSLGSVVGYDYGLASLLSESCTFGGRGTACVLTPKTGLRALSYGRLFS